MAIEKSLLTGSTTTLILKLLEERDMYGYEMIETLAQRSDHTLTSKPVRFIPFCTHWRSRHWWNPTSSVHRRTAFGNITT